MRAGGMGGQGVNMGGGMGMGGGQGMNGMQGFMNGGGNTTTLLYSLPILFVCKHKFAMLIIGFSVRMPGVQGSAGSGGMGGGGMQGFMNGGGCLASLFHVACAFDACQMGTTLNAAFCDQVGEAACGRRRGSVAWADRA